MPRTTPTSPVTLTARCPDDVLALVPVLLGFVPHDSVVMLTFGAAESFHARVDAPSALDDVSDVVDALLVPARRHRVTAVVLVVYSDRDRESRHLAAVFCKAFRGAGITVAEMLRADGRRWFPLLAEAQTGRPGAPYDVASHPFSAQAVLRGQVTHASRESLAASLEVDPPRAARVASLVADLATWSPVDEPPTHEQLAEGEWVHALVSAAAASDSTPSDREVARLLRSIQVTRVRDAAWCTITRRDAAQHVALWTDVCRRTPQGLLAPPATLLGWAAWQAGHGALAWCAADLATGCDPRYRLAGYLVQALEQAIPPSAWEPLGDWREGLMSR